MCVCVSADDVLPELGVRMEDRSNGDIWKLDDPELLRKERQQREVRGWGGIVT